MNQVVSLVVLVWQKFKNYFVRDGRNFIPSHQELNGDKMKSIGKFNRANESYALSKTSQERLDQCCDDLKSVVNELLHYMDVSVLEGERTKADQEKYYKKGTSNAKFGQSPHNYHPSLAVDIIPYPVPKTSNGEWDNNSEIWNDMSMLVKEISKELGIDIIWGGDFKSLVDKPHFEIANWKSLIKGLVENV